MVADSQAPYAERVDCTAGWPANGVAQQGGQGAADDILRGPPDHQFAERLPHGEQLLQPACCLSIGRPGAGRHYCCLHLRRPTVCITCWNGIMASAPLSVCWRAGAGDARGAPGGMVLRGQREAAGGHGARPRRLGHPQRRAAGPCALAPSADATPHFDVGQASHQPVQACCRSVMHYQRTLSLKPVSLLHLHVLQVGYDQHGYGYRDLEGSKVRFMLHLHCSRIGGPSPCSCHVETESCGPVPLQCSSSSHVLRVSTDIGRSTKACGKRTASLTGRGT